jgi:DNA mismatch repair ATPase MutL
MIALLQGYCMVRSDVQFRCTNMTGKSRTDVLNTPGSQELRTCVVNLFGAKQVRDTARFLHPACWLWRHRDSIVTAYYPAPALDFFSTSTQL